MPALVQHLYQQASFYKPGIINILRNQERIAKNQDNIIKSINSLFLQRSGATDGLATGRDNETVSRGMGQQPFHLGAVTGGAATGRDSVYFSGGWGQTFFMWELRQGWFDSGEVETLGVMFLGWVMIVMMILLIWTLTQMMLQLGGILQLSWENGRGYSKFVFGEG